MSLPADLGVPQRVTIKCYVDEEVTEEVDGKFVTRTVSRKVPRKGRLHPLAWTEYGELTVAYEAHLRNVAIRSTEGCKPHERKRALEAAAKTVAMLSVDIQPLWQWVLTSNMGVASALFACLEMEDGELVSSHDLSVWIYEVGGLDETDNVIDKWMIASGIRSDPTEIEAESSQDDSSVPPRSDSEESTEPSLAGATE